jgi:hypothetical protein
VIEGFETSGYTLFCDNCGEECDDTFDEFYDAVDYKRDPANRWRTIKDKDDEWCELCPACNTTEVIRKLKGVEDL